jgi:hypothetical protein
MPLPTGNTNETVSEDTHPALHNDVNAAVNTLETSVAGNTSAIGALEPRVTALETTDTETDTRLDALEADIVRRPKGRLAVVPMTLSSTPSPVNLVTGTRPMTGWYVRATVVFNGCVNPNALINVVITAPGYTSETFGLTAAAGAAPNSRTGIAIGAATPTGNGTVTATITCGASTLLGTVSLMVDDMGAV